jgi:hypothetical protein
VLPIIIERAKESGLIKDVISHLVPVGVSMLQYAEATIFPF